MASELCPVCSSLPLDTLTFGSEGPCLEYHLDGLEVNSNTDVENSFAQCALYYLCRSMKRIWEGKDEYPTDLAWVGPPMLHTACGGEGRSRVWVRTDQNTEIARLQRSQRWLPVHSDPQHPLVIARLREWIRTCDANHEGCRGAVNSVLPTRVLDLEAGFSSSVIKLVETEPGQVGRYIALSHCWGTSQPFVTTRDSLGDMKGGFQLSKAPATFQDAVTISRLLGVRYLWIDSLCIIQGDAADWEIESSRMGTVYRDAYLVLSASNSTADAEGFLKPRRHTHSTLTITPGSTSPSSQQKAEIFLVPTRDEPTDHWAYWDFNQALVQPLDTRGWCLQETYLARRQLKYLHNRILWACQDAQQDEGQKDSTVSMAGTGAISATLNLFRNHVPRRHRSLNLMTPYQGWYRMVAEYTRRKLTFEMDKMAAVSGLAGVVAGNDGGEYVAGVWWEDVAFGICWKKVVDNGSGLVRTSAYVAPSWSWASVDGAVEFLDAHENYTTQTKLSLIDGVRFDSYAVRNAGIDKFGRVENAWLKAKAPLARLESSETGRLRIRGVEAAEEQQVELSFDIEEEIKQDLSVMFLLQRLNNAPETSLIHQGYEKGALGVILFGLIIKPVLDSRKKLNAFEGADGAGVFVYERVGMFRILTSSGRGRDFWEDGSTSVVLV